MEQEDKHQHIETQPQQQQQQHQQMSVNNRFATDLLQRFISGNHLNNRVCEEMRGEEEENIELSLGLSLNGRFGVDPRAKKLTRSSSIPDFIHPARENGSVFMLPVGSTNLVRTCSLPTETDEEWRKRKEMQMLRRMEAKRKRSEKQRNLKALKDRNKGFLEDSCEEEQRENGTISHNCDHQQEQVFKNFNGLFGAGAEGILPGSQRSIGSQGSGSSGSESESQPVQGMNKCSEARSPVSVQSLSECEQKLTATHKLTINEKTCSPAGVAMVISRSNEPTILNGAKEVRNILEDMPCVSTKGDGPNGKRIEGFLYRYRKGEEVRIVCVCHGSFLSPAEFVKHAGGGDVAHPLKHIVVNPYPLL